MKKIGIVMGSKSDLPTVEKAVGVLKEYGVPLKCASYPPIAVRLKQKSLLAGHARADFQF